MPDSKTFVALSWDQNPNSLIIQKGDGNIELRSSDVAIRLELTERMRWVVESIFGRKARLTGDSGADQSNCIIAPGECGWLFAAQRDGICLTLHLISQQNQTATVRFSPSLNIPDLPTRPENTQIIRPDEYDDLVRLYGAIVSEVIAGTLMRRPLLDALWSMSRWNGVKFDHNRAYTYLQAQGF